MSVPDIGQIDDELLNAYLDGELSPPERVWLEVQLATEPDVQNRLRAYRRHEAALKEGYESVLNEPIPERLLETISEWIVPTPSSGKAG